MKYIFFEKKENVFEKTFPGRREKIMKLKRCFKTVLSSVLAAAMLITAVPSNLTLDVQAAPAEEVVVETETATEEAVAAEDVAATVEASTEAAEDTTTEAVVEEKEENVEPEVGEDNSAVDTSTGYWGPTINYTNGNVKIYWYGTSDVPNIMGNFADDGWTNGRALTEEEEGVYFAEITQDELSTVEYKFKSGLKITTRTRQNHDKSA